MKKPSRKSRQPGSSARGYTTADRSRLPFSRELSVLYEDESLVVVNKPAGLLAVPIKGSDTPSALSLLTNHFKARRQRVLVVHRIDRFVSGILLFAKTRDDRDALVKQFLDHTPARQYLAIVRGRINLPSGTLVHYFRRVGMFQQLRSAKDPNAARAELRYTVERLFADASLVRVELVTGLQNQIRAQFLAFGHPVIGDRKYHQAEASEQRIDRVALHAAHLRLIHPRSGDSVSIDCPPPADFQRLLRELSRAAGGQK